MQTELKKLAGPGPENHILYVQTENGDITYISPSGENYFQLPFEELIGKKEADLFDDDISFDLMEIDQRVLITGRPHHYQIKRQKSDDTEIIFVTKYLVNDAETTEPQLISVLQLAKNESKGEKHAQVKPLNQQFLALQSAITAVSNSLDIEHITKTFTWEMANLLNASACVYYLWQEEQTQLLLQSGYDQTSSIEFEEILTLSTHPFLRQVLEEQTIRQFSQIASPSTGHELLYLTQLNVSALLLIPVAVQGRLLGIALIGEQTVPRTFAESETAVARLLADQTASTIFNAQLYTELLKTNERLIESNSDLQAFARTTAHDLKAPVGSIIGFADLLVKEHENFSQQEMTEFLNIILRSSQQMRTIIDNLLLLASVRQQDIPIAPVKMESVLSEVFTRLAYLIKQNNCEIIMQETWPLSFGNAHWLQEVWSNYISNAIKYGGEPPVIELGATQYENGAVRFWVKDNGVGLSPIEQEKLFIPFSRIHQKGNSQGHGLGLSIVQRIMHKLGGSVGVESSINNGSLFYFTLPASHPIK